MSGVVFVAVGSDGLISERYEFCVQSPKWTLLLRVTHFSNQFQNKINTNSPEDFYDPTLIYSDFMARVSPFQPAVLSLSIPDFRRGTTQREFLRTVDIHHHCGLEERNQWQVLPRYLNPSTRTCGHQSSQPSMMPLNLVSHHHYR